MFGNLKFKLLPMQISEQSSIALSALYPWICICNMHIVNMRDDDSGFEHSKVHIEIAIRIQGIVHYITYIVVFIM